MCVAEPSPHGSGAIPDSLRWGLPPCRCASASVAGCLYVHEISSMRDTTACPADCYAPVCFLPCAARCPPACCLLSAVCRLSFVRQVAPACRFAWRAALSGISGIAAPALFPAPSCCSCLFLLLPAFSCCSRPPLPGRGRPEKVTAQPLSGCAADREYACRYSGSFPVPQRVLGLGPSHSSSRPPRANSSCGNQKLLSTRPLRRACWI